MAGGISACIPGVVQACPVHSLAGASKVGGDFAANTGAPASTRTPNAKMYVPGVLKRQPLVGKPVSVAIGHVVVGPIPISMVRRAPGWRVMGSGW